jgi:large repetitive protein
MKKILLFVVVGITLLAIPATIFLVGQNQELRKRAAPATTIAFSPSNTTAKQGETFTLEAKVDTADNQIMGAEINVTFDPAALEAVTITNGSFAPTILTSGVVEGGTASITVGAANQATPIKGQGVVAVLKMKALKASPTAISVRFSSDTFLSALGEGTKNVLIGSTPASVTILNADGSRATADTTITTTTDTTSFASTSATPVPTLIITPSQESSQSGESSASALLITRPINNGNVATLNPTISGKAAPGSTITLTIYSDPLNAVVTADENGNWAYTPQTPLANGPHSVVALVMDASGGTQTTTTNFVVATVGGSESATESAMPTAGNIETSILIVAVGMLLFISGALLPIFIH